MDGALTPLVTATDLPLPRLRQGKVRDVYEVDAEHLLMVATDRISAFDVVLSPGIPDKGACLTQMSNFWFERVAVDHHLVGTTTHDLPEALDGHHEQLRGRAVLVERLEPLPVECIVRGHLAGSGWKEYQAKGTICGVPLPAGLKEASPLPAPIFTPSTKAPTGHDINIPFQEMAKIVGKDETTWLQEASLRIYEDARAHAARRGILIADTKFEFGRRRDGSLVLMDEILTPDSSRFWPADRFKPGGPQPSFDKQFVRDYLETLEWDKTPPGPRLPAAVVAGTSSRYKEAYRILTGRPFAVPA